MYRLVSILMENEPGALSRVVGLFSQRGFNIHSLTVAPTDDPTLSRLTLTTDGDSGVVEQITKQLNKLIEVVKVADLNEGPRIDRELMLVKVRVPGLPQRSEVRSLSEIFGGQIVDTTPVTYTIQMTGKSSRLNDFLNVLGDIQILEVARTGAASLARGEKHLSM